MVVKGLIRWVRASRKERKERSQKKSEEAAQKKKVQEESASHLTRHGRILDEDAEKAEAKLSAEDKYGASHLDLVRSHGARGNPSFPKLGQKAEHLRIEECKSLEEFFMSDRYPRGLACTVEAYAEELFDLGETKVGTFLHGPSGIQVWQYALDLCSTKSRVQLREVFSRFDQGRTGHLSVKETGEALRELSFEPLDEELRKIFQEHGGQRARATTLKCVTVDEFIKVVERKYRDERVLFFHYTDERGFRLITDPGNMKVSDLWCHLTTQDGYFGRGLYVNSKAPDEWDGQWEIQVNNLWPCDEEKVDDLPFASVSLRLPELTGHLIYLHWQTRTGT